MAKGWGGEGGTKQILETFGKMKIQKGPEGCGDTTTSTQVPPSCVGPFPELPALLLVKAPVS